MTDTISKISFFLLSFLAPSRRLPPSSLCPSVYLFSSSTFSLFLPPSFFSSVFSFSSPFCDQTSLSAFFLAMKS